MRLKPRAPFAIDQLNQMQRYLGEEMIEDYQTGELTRRQMLIRVLKICGSASAAAALLVACGEAATPAAPTNAPEPTSAPAAATTAPAPTSAPEPTSAPPASTTAPAPTRVPEPTAAVVATLNPLQPLNVDADDPALQAAEITYQSDTEIFGYFTRPAAEGTYPGVIVIHENRGLTDHIRDVARRVAKAGYLVLAPDLASRAGGTATVGSGGITGFFANANPDELISDLNAGIVFLEQQPGIRAERFGVVGFCFGGAYTLRLAAANPKIAAAVCYYGVTPQPAEQLSATNAAILGQYGADDSRVNSTIPALEEVMLANGKTFEKQIYEGARHAFNNDTGQNYNQAVAVQAWQRTLDWFATHLG
jgi:carboxymethylenebutenolidase